MSIVKDNSKEPFDYIDKWKREKEYYKKAIIDPKTGETWPRITPTEEAEYENWKGLVVDPATLQYYRGKDDKFSVSEDGVETKKTVEVEPSEVVRQITRVRTPEGEEFLVTKGTLTGYDEFGKPHKYDYSNKEMYRETLFKYRTDRDESINRLRQFCEGPSGFREHYLMPFTSGNVDKLWAKRDKSTRCLLVVFDTITKDAKQALDIDMFKTKSFDYIMEMQYLTEKEREEKRKEYEAMQGIASQQKPSGGKK